jgi:predicted dienelactone hydrolase
MESTYESGYVIDFRRQYRGKAIMQRWTWFLVCLACVTLGLGRYRLWAAEQDLPTPGAVLPQADEPKNTRRQTSAASPQDYDPLRILENRDSSVLEMSFSDEIRKRTLPLRIYLPPKSSEPLPVVLFSHGLGGSREGSTFLGQHWSKRGYIAVFLQHPGSDESVWKNESLAGRRRALAQAASAEQLKLRLGDVSAVLDQLERWHQDPKHELHQQVDLQRVGMSGHSFGAVTTQNISGQSNALGRSSTDPRIRAALIMSPGIPAVGNAERAFRSVKVPWLLMTGTHDDSPLGEQTPATRRQVFPALPPGDKYELVLDQAEHSIFTDRKLLGEKKQRNPEHHRSIEAISTAFWDAYLRNDPDAKAWLQGEQVRSVLSKPDQWQKK